MAGGTDERRDRAESALTWIMVDGDRIGATGSGRVPSGAEDLDGLQALPGFVDMHCHGGGGGSYTSADPVQIALAAATHLSAGTTTTNASLVSARHEDLCRQILALIPFVDDGTLHGIHLEGPWISSSYCGAHDPEVLRDPDPEEISALLALADGRISMVTLAPELPGAVESIRRVVEAGAVAAVGHTAAEASHTRAAVAAGARVATHLFNAMPPLLHREPGAVGALLMDPRVTVELICDRVHLSPEVVAIALSAAEGRCAFITDAMSAAGAGDGDYLVGELQVRVQDGQARAVGSGSLAGSTLLMSDVLRHAVTACGRRIDEVSRALSANPARALGLKDRGRVDVGMRADVVLVDDDLVVRRVLRAGRWVS